MINACDLEVQTHGNKLCKFVDDSCLIIPATTLTGGHREQGLITWRWAERNWKKSSSEANPLLSGLVRANVYGVTVTKAAQVSDNVRDFRCDESLTRSRRQWFGAAECKSSSGWLLSRSCCSLYFQLLVHGTDASRPSRVRLLPDAWRKINWMQMNSSPTDIVLANINNVLRSLPYLNSQLHHITTVSCL